jgi:hypothetical protein
MASLPGPESRDVQEMIRHLKWSHAEKQIARKAFELLWIGNFEMSSGGQRTWPARSNNRPISGTWSTI